MEDENLLIKSLGLYDDTPPKKPQGGENVDYDVVPDPKAEEVDLSELRGVTSDEKPVEDGANSDTELEALAEIVPDIKSRRQSTGENAVSTDDGGDAVGPLPPGNSDAERPPQSPRKMSMGAESTNARRPSAKSQEEDNQKNRNCNRTDSMRALESGDMDESNNVRSNPGYNADYYQAGNEASENHQDDTTFDEYPDSDHVLDDDDPQEEAKVPKEFVNMSSANSISTATQTHELRMPMYLPTFKPATGCTNASDFIVRCFIARLRSGITVVKHGRSRWCKSRLRVLHIHPDGRSLSWKPAEGEPNSSKRPPKLDLSTCLEVRHAWSPDPQNPMYTGTPILRQKCEAANAHKSFALIFKQRTVDITAVTADQCKVLMEGFSALCFRLQVATLAGRGGRKGQAMPEEDGVSTTASATLTNTSTPRGR